MTIPPENGEPSVPPDEVQPEPAQPKGRPKRWRKWKLYLGIALASPLLALLLYTAVMYNWSYSEGNRSGILRKFSRKGWICKTWEGELAQTTVPGVMPESWLFTVRHDSVAALVNSALGKNVVLHYSEHRGLWSRCFGETPYFVDSVRIN